MDINLIVANSINGVIGKNGSLPWHNSEDLKRFKEITTNGYVIMGRKTFESIGKPLPNRVNLVLSKTSPDIPGTRVFRTVDSVLSWLGNQELAFSKLSLDVFIIGGGEIYQEFLKTGQIKKIYQTEIKENVDGDVFFQFDKIGWELSHIDFGDGYNFMVWDKKVD